MSNKSLLTAAALAALGLAVAYVPSASALQGCGIGWHRGCHGHCYRNACNTGCGWRPVACRHVVYRPVVYRPVVYGTYYRSGCNTCGGYYNTGYTGCGFGGCGGGLGLGLGLGGGCGARGCWW